MLDKKVHQKATIAGFRWNMINQVLSQVFTFIIGIILMNLLTPEDFGIVAMATIFTGFLNLFSKFGLGASLVQTPKINRYDIDSVFWASLGVSILLTLIMYLSSKPIAVLYKEPSLISIIQVLSLSFLFLPFSTVPSSLLQKNLKFKELFYVNFISELLSSIIAIILALRGYGAWTLVYHRLSASSIQTIGLWLISSFRPTYKFSKKHLRKHLRFGLPYIGSKSFIYLIGTADNFIIGYLLGVRQLGLYSRAYSLSTIPANRLGLIFSTVLFPSFAQLREDKLYLSKMFQLLNSVIFFFIAPLMLILSLSSESIILLISSDDWLLSAKLLKYLAFVAITKVNIQIFHNLLLSQGKSDIDFKLNLVSGAIFTIIFIIGSFVSIEFFVQLYLATSIIILLIWYVVISKYLDISLRKFSKSIMIYIANTVFILVSWKVAMSYYQINNNWLNVAVVVMYVGGLWVLLSYFFEKENLIIYLELLIKFLKK